MKKIFLSLSIVLVVGLCGCDVSETKMFKSYIVKYVDYEDIKLELSEKGNIKIVGNNPEYGYSYNSATEENKAKYDSLCRVNNDLTYNTKRSYIAFPSWGKTSSIHFTKIDIVSNKDFDSDLPAGTSLKDMVGFVSNSPKWFIDSGYKDTFDWDSDNIPESFRQEPETKPLSYLIDRDKFFPIEKKLSDLSADDCKILGNGNGFLGCLLFYKEPTLNKEHIFTITIHTADNRVFTKTITKSF